MCHKNERQEFGGKNYNVGARLPRPYEMKTTLFYNVEISLEFRPSLAAANAVGAEPIITLKIANGLARVWPNFSVNVTRVVTSAFQSPLNINGGNLKTRRSAVHSTLKSIHCACSQSHARA